MKVNKVSFLFAWFDLWVGFFWDKKTHWLYFLPIPMFGIIFRFLPPGFVVYEDTKSFYRVNSGMFNYEVYSLRAAYEKAWQVYGNYKKESYQ